MNTHTYTPTCTLAERQAYAAAHRISKLTNSGESELACPGAIRSRMIDRIAEIIGQEFGVFEEKLALECTK